jgi:hypothetical protein
MHFGYLIATTDLYNVFLRTAQFRHSRYYISRQFSMKKLFIFIAFASVVSVAAGFGQNRVQQLLSNQIVNQRIQREQVTQNQQRIQKREIQHYEATQQLQKANIQHKVNAQLQRQEGYLDQEVSS